MKSNYEIKEYQSNQHKLWDEFIQSSPNGTLLHFRDFMDYHKDRLEDASLMMYHKNKLIAVLPANSEKSTIYSHAGLTFGGLVLSKQASSEDVLYLFEGLVNHFRNLSFTEFVYKQMPYIYHQAYASIDDYMLYRLGFELKACAISSFSPLHTAHTYTEEKKRNIQKANKAGIYIQETDLWENFWQILEQNLTQRHNSTPTHSLAEIQHLKAKFPQHIQLIGAFQQDELLAGTILFISQHVVHIQYIASSELGRLLCANDLLVSSILESNAFSQTFFDYGISTENNGKILNRGLLHHKEGFGLQAICYKSYQLKL